jgi:hypothetical protein
MPRAAGATRRRRAANLGSFGGAQRISMQSSSSGWHGSSNTVPPRAEPAAAGAAPPPEEVVGVARAPFGIDDRIELLPSEPAFVRIVGVPIEAGAPPLGDEVGPPTEGIVCTRPIVEVGVPMLRVAAVPTIACAEAPVAGIDDGELVDAPIDGALAVPIVERVGATSEDDAAPSVCESVVEVDPVVPSEVSAGSVAKAEAPIPNFAAKELKSLVKAKPSVASKASKAGSDAAGMIAAVSVGNVSVSGLATVEVVVPKPPIVGPALNVDCAAAIQGVAMSATGATHPVILFISPPCSNLHVQIDHRRTRVVPRGVVGRPAYH